MARIVKQTSFKARWYHIVLVRFLWILILVIIIGTFSAEYFLIVKPKIYQARSGGPLDISTHEQILAEQQQYLEDLKALKAEAETINKTELEKLYLVVANKAEMPAILSQIESLAAQATNMQLIGLGLNIEQGVISISLSFKGGDYRIIKEYLSTIEKNIRIMDVASLSIKELGNLFSLNIDTYYLE